MLINIAIDGPSAAGKSTIADLLAEKLGYIHLDTGAMYRAVAYNALKKEIPYDDEEAIVAMIDEMDLVMDTDGDVLLDGEDITEAIRANEISMGASDVSKLQKCREAMRCSSWFSMKLRSAPVADISWMAGISGPWS